MLTRWDPFRDLKAVEDEFDRMVGQAFSKNAWVPALDIRETEDRFEVTVDLPGMRSDDVERHVRGRHAHGPRASGNSPARRARGSTTASSGAMAASRGRCACRRVADPERIEASFDKGVLTVLVPKREAGEGTHDRGQGHVSDERERDEEQPRVRITDRRRFANLRDDEGAPAGPAGAAPAPADETTEQEAAEVAGDLQAAQGEAQQYLRSPSPAAGGVRQLPQARR